MIANKHELTEFFTTNAQTYQFLSQAFFKELNVEAIKSLADADWPQNTGNEHLDEGYALMRRYFAFGVPDRRQQLAVEYSRIFLAAGVFSKEVRTAVPYESVFTSEEHTMMGASRDDVVARFREDGFAVDPALHEPEDHLSFELEYLQVMCERAAALVESGDGAGLARNISRQAAFIDSHLLNWLPILADAVNDYAKFPFYPGLLLVTRGTLEEARAALADLAADLCEADEIR